MVTTPIPRWLAALDEEKPHLEVLGGATQPDVSPHYPHGRIAVRLEAQLDEWAGDEGGVGVDEWRRPRIAPDLAVEIVSPSDRPGRLRRKVEIYLEFGSAVVMVVHPIERRIVLHRADGSVEERQARGAWPLEPFDGLVLDWEKIYRGIRLD